MFNSSTSSTYGLFDWEPLFLLMWLYGSNILNLAIGNINNFSNWTNLSRAELSPPPLWLSLWVSTPKDDHLCNTIVALAHLKIVSRKLYQKRRKKNDANILAKNWQCGYNWKMLDWTGLFLGECKSCFLALTSTSTSTGSVTFSCAVGR